MMTTSRDRHHPTPFAALLSALLLLIGAMTAAPAAAGDPAGPAEQEQAEPGSMAARCQAMMAAREEMMHEREAMDAEIDELLSAVQSASGDAKVAAMEDLLEALVEQRRAMRSMMMQGQGGMMGHMMQHMAMMHSKGDMMMGEGGMGDCPMMKGMMSGATGEDGPEADEGHAAHHPE